MSESRDQNLPDLDYIRELAKIFTETELDEIEIETGEQRVLLRRSDTPAPVIAAAPAPVVTMAQGPAPVAAPASEPAANDLAAAAAAEPAGDFITSPFVGTFYRAPNPDSAPFVDVGASVQPGAVVCVVEAMKLFNEIEVEFPCVVEEVLVDNAQPVEFGTKLFRVRKL